MTNTDHRTCSNCGKVVYYGLFCSNDCANAWARQKEASRVYLVEATAALEGIYADYESGRAASPSSTDELDAIAEAIGFDTDELDRPVYASIANDLYRIACDGASLEDRAREGIVQLTGEIV
jgi:hypothetical protein